MGRFEPRNEPCHGLTTFLADPEAAYQMNARHGEHLNARSVQLTGMRIFIRTRREPDDAPALFKAVKAVVPAPKMRAECQNPPIPFEAPS